MSTVVRGRYKLIRLLRSLQVPERHIRAALQSELGLSTHEANEAMAEDSTPSDADPS